VQIQIFASDISDIAIAKARLGFYNPSQLLNVPETILKKYFAKKGGSYQVKKPIRESCVFAVHNFLKDPPFAKNGHHCLSQCADLYGCFSPKESAYDVSLCA